MPELAAIPASSAPVTRARVAADLAQLGVRPGRVLLVHSSRSALGQHMGAIAETARTWPGARRSDHPQVSFARGKRRRA